MTLNVVAITCATEKCCEPIYMRQEQLDQYKSSSATFRCPKGHSNYFPKGPSTADKLRKEVQQLKRQLEIKDGVAQSIDRQLQETRQILIENLHEPGVHYIGSHHYVWVCTCGRKGRGTMGEYNTKRLLLIHQDGMHCNPIPGLQVTA